MGDVETDIDSAFNKWLDKIEKSKIQVRWADRFIQTFMMYFPADQIHIIDGENMAHNAQEKNAMIIRGCVFQGSHCRIIFKLENI